ncbi:MAG TPA: hypothetical protein VF327_12650 [Gaiellaceae bacterium]
MKIALVIVLAFAVVSAGCGGSAGKTESADAFMRRITIEFSRGQSGRLWDSLVPAEQRVVTKQRYLACQRNGGFRLKSFKVLDTYSEGVEVEGKQTPSTAVTVQVTSDDGVTTATMHAVKSSGSWHWMLQPADLAAYAAGRCP